MTKKGLPKYVYEKPGGGIYFQRRGFKTVRFKSAKDTPEFAAEHAAILMGRPPVPDGKTLKSLVISYQLSDRFTGLSDRSKSDYMRVLDYVKDKLGHLSAERMQRKDVIRAQESNKDAVRFANYIVQVLRVMFEHAIDQGWRDDNPAKGVRLIKSTKPKRLPWPDDRITAFRTCAPLGTRHRLTSDLRAAVGATEKAGETICAQPNGRPTSYDGAWGMIMTVRKQIDAEAYDLHALRHTTAHELAALGCTDELIMAVTGHSSRAMVAHYAGSARQKARATEAQSMRERIKPKS